jgi:hypothetical protein
MTSGAGLTTGSAGVARAARRATARTLGAGLETTGVAVCCLDRGNVALAATGCG